MTMSEVVQALAAALPQIANPSKDGKSHHGRYSTLPALLDHVKPVLAEHGLAVTQDITSDGIYTTVIHTSGELYRWGPYPVEPAKGPQAQGSAETYGRRYALQAALGVSGADDDGNVAQKATQRPRMVSQSQMKAMHAAFGVCGIKDRADKLEFVVRVVGHPVESSTDLTSKEAAQVLNELAEMRPADVV